MSRSEVLGGRPLMRPLIRPQSLGFALLACSPKAATVELEPSPTAAPTSAEPTTAPAPSTTAPPAPEPPLVTEGPPVPGFAIYTQDQTIVIPLDGTLPRIAEGLWLQDDRSSPPVLTHTLVMSPTRADAVGVPACACVGLDDACEYDSLEARRFDGRTGAPLPESDSPCACMRRAEPPGSPPIDVDGEHYEACAGSEDEIIASLVAGQLLYQGWEGNGACQGGLNLYDATSRSVALIPAPPELTNAGTRARGCNPELGPAFAERPWPIDRAALTNDCEDYYEAELFMLRRGDLWTVRDDISGVHGVRHYRKRAARPESCPSSNDPCGDPEPFRARAGLDRRRREYWVATDGSAALTGEGHDWSLWLADADAAIEFELTGTDATHDVLGVRSHADTRPLLAIIAKHPQLGQPRTGHAAALIEPELCREHHDPRDAELGARELGNECFMYIGISQWRAAEAACLHGLARAAEPGTRGALLFNLGLIAEAQGAVEQAIAHYRASLEIRPGNRTVERRLAKLAKP